MALLSPVLVALILAATPPAHSTAPAPDTISVTDDARRRLTIDVHIGALGPFHFLIDTGAQNTVLADDLAGRLGVLSRERHTVVGVAGALDVDTVSLDDIQIGRRAFNQRFVPVLRGDVIQADGILGIDALQGQRVLFDFTRNILTISDARDHQDDDGYNIVVTARRRMGQLIVTHARINGVAADLVIDTGTEVSIGNRALQRQLARAHAGEPARLVGVTGQVIDVDMMTTGALQVDDLTLAHMLIAYADSPAFAALHLDRRPALLLGMRELRAMKRVAIDFAHRKVLFEVSG